MAKHPKLTKVEEDFKKIEKIIKFEDKKTKKIDTILENIALYKINPDSSCIRMYKFYGLKDSYPESEIRKIVKKLIQEYYQKAISFLKLQKSHTLFNV